VGAGFEFKLLGPLEVMTSGYTVPIKAAKQRVVLASLLVDTGRVVAVDQLVTRLWDRRAHRVWASFAGGRPGSR
jgi:DNA-binding SARP family transcriptional activator